MPIYEYRRPDGTTFEIMQSFADDALTHDPETGVAVQRVLHAPAVHFKGQGLLQHRLRDPQAPARERGGGGLGRRGSGSASDSSDGGGDAGSKSGDSSPSSGDKGAAAGDKGSSSGEKGSSGGKAKGGSGLGASSGSKSKPAATKG